MIPMEFNVGAVFVFCMANYLAIDTFLYHPVLLCLVGDPFLQWLC